MKVLLTGASGLLGRYLMARAPKDVQILPTFYQHPIDGGLCVDMTTPASIFYAFNKADPDVVIHCAGVSDVDACEKNPVFAEATNVTGTAWLCRAAEEYGARVVYVSTNAVFDGENAPYSEGDECKPVNKYGQIKLRAERTVTDLVSAWTIVRPILLYGWTYSWGRQNWASRVYWALSNGATLRVVDDTLTQPTYAGWAADAIWRLIEGRYDGIYHLGGANVMSLLAFCNYCLLAFGKPAQILPASSADFPTIAPRPRDTTYNLSKISEIIQPLNIYDGLAQMRDENWIR